MTIQYLERLITIGSYRSLQPWLTFKGYSQSLLTRFLTSHVFSSPSTWRSKKLGRRWKKSSQVIVTYNSVPTCSHNIWVDFGLITPLPPDSPANVVTPNGNGLISIHFAYNSTLFGVGGGRSLVLLLSLGGSQHQFKLTSIEGLFPWMLTWLHYY